MIRSDIFTQAQGGNPEAIAALMNHSLQRKQVTVRAGLREGCLTVLATSRDGPDAAFMANFVRRGLDRLQPQGIERVTIRGYAIGAIDSLWSAEYTPNDPAPLSISQRPQSQIPRSSQPRSGPPRSGQPRSSKPRSSKPRTRRSRTRRHRSRQAHNPASSAASATATLPRSSQPRTARTARPTTSPPRTSRPRKATTEKASSTLLQKVLSGLAAILFVALSVGIVILAFQSKVITAELTEASIYQIQFLGDLLRGIEAAEVFNIFVFAILGLGLGLSTMLVPRRFGIRVNATIGLLALPVILSVSSVIRYHSWVDEFATAERLTGDQAIAQTDIYLQSKVERAGFFGFYLYTARYPGLPSTRVQMSQTDALESQAADRMGDVLATLPFSLELPQLFAICMWGIRLFYLFLSLLTAIGNFAQGVRWADRLMGRLPDPEESTDL